MAKVEPAPFSPPAAAVPAAEAPPTAEPLPSPPIRTEPQNATLSYPQSAPPPPEPPHTVTLNTGLLIPVRLADWLLSERNVPGDPFIATLDQELVADGFVIAERGARVEGRVVAVDRGVRVRGLATLAVELTRLSTSDGQRVPIRTDSFERRTPTRGTPPTLPSEARLDFRLRAAVTLTEKRNESRER